MERKVLCILHQKHSRIRRVGNILKKMGYFPKIIRPCIGENLPVNVEEYSGVIIFGGPMSAYEEKKYPFISKEINWVSGLIDKKIPLLGICLGAQLIAKSLGAEVRPLLSKKHEIGYFPIYPSEIGKDLFMGKKLLYAYQWHKDGFDLPKGADLLASGDVFKNQAFSFGNHIFGLQFHPELTPKTMFVWSSLAKKRKLDFVQPIEETLNLSMKNEITIRKWFKNFLQFLLI